MLHVDPRCLKGTNSLAHSKMLIEALQLNLSINSSNGAYRHNNGKVQLY